MRLWPSLLWAAALVAMLFGAVYLLGTHPGGGRSGVLSGAAWQRMASPGALSRPHAFLEHNCTACHTPVKGVEAANCIVCHADDVRLLQRQPTAFHGDVQSCRQCHAEHQGGGRHPAAMDHSALADIGLRELSAGKPPDDEGRLVRDELVAWIRRNEEATLPAGRPMISPREAALDCAVCHATKDRHRGFFGRDCAECHGTAAWTIPAFRHPSEQSQDCAQCHQAPPSHFMEHFHMISARVAQQEHARVDQCFLCHQTTAWNDIKGVGYYKHH